MDPFLYRGAPGGLNMESRGWSTYVELTCREGGAEAEAANSDSKGVRIAISLSVLFENHMCLLASSQFTCRKCSPKSSRAATGFARSRVCDLKGEVNSVRSSQWNVVVSGCDGPCALQNLQLEDK